MSTTAAPTANAVEIVRGIYAAFDRGDLAAILAASSPDATVHQTPELPWGGHHLGHAGLQRFVGALTASVQARFVPQTLFAAGDQVVSVGHSRGTVRANGRAFEVAAVHVWTVVDGRVTRFDAYIDTPAMLAALS
jgi:hypothetical protein